MDLVRTSVTAAAAAYAANFGLGLSVASGAVDTSSVRWVHHGLYILTATVTTSAVVLGALRRDRAALALAPTALPLVLLQRHGALPLGRHARNAVLAAPFYATALILSRR